MSSGGSVSASKAMSDGFKNFSGGNFTLIIFRLGVTFTHIYSGKPVIENKA
jgi:hypothetical protein